MFDIFFKNKSLIFILFTGIFLRVYNINFDDYWYDEIISFWVSNPEHTFSKSFQIHNKIELNTYAYHLLLKIFYSYITYDPFFGRYLSVFFSVLSLFLILFFFENNEVKGLRNFSLFLFSFNIYLISYSQEARVYSILFFFVLLIFLFFFKIIKNESNNKNYFGLILSCLFSILLHPFSFIILISLILFLILKFFFQDLTYKKLNYSILVILIVSIIYYLFYLSSLVHTNSEHYWIKQPGIKFYSNLFFSNFFGSRLIGGIFLFTLICLIVYQRKVFLKLNFLTVFFISILLAYTLPILFGYLFKPVLISRYIMFILIPIILLIANLIFKIKNNRIKNLLVGFLVFITIGNHFTEQTFQQLIYPRVPSKPEYNKAIKFLGNSEIKNYFIKVENMKNNSESINSIENYLNFLKKKNNLEIDFLNLNNEVKKNLKIWQFCPQDINSKNCYITEKILNYEIIEEKSFNSINLKLISLK